MDNCIFCKIATKDIPAQTVYEDDEMLCFKDIRPAAPVHLLLIPKVHFDSLAHATAEHQTLLGKMMLKVPQIAHEAGLTDGFKPDQHRERRRTRSLPPAYPYHGYACIIIIFLNSTNSRIYHG